MQRFEQREWWKKRRVRERLASERFLEASVTAAFLLAAADGSASGDEYDELLDKFTRGAGADRDAVDALLTNAAQELESSGFEGALAHVSELVGDPTEAEAALMLALATALADGEVSGEEREVAGQLAGQIGLVAADLDALLTEIRGGT